MRGKLISLAKDGKELKVFPVVSLHVFIGSDSYCDLRIKHNEISPQHCLITVQKDKPAVIRNLSRTSPTLVNGVEVGQKSVELQDQDVITIRHRQFKWCYDGILSPYEASIANLNKGRKSWPLFPNKLVAVVTPLKRVEEKELPLKKRRATFGNVNASSRKSTPKVVALKPGVKGARKFNSPRKSSIKISPSSSVKMSSGTPCQQPLPGRKSVKFLVDTQKSRLGKRSTKGYGPSTPYRPSNTPGKTTKESLYFTPPSTFGSAKKPVKSILKTPGSTSVKTQTHVPLLPDLSTTPPALTQPSIQPEVESGLQTPPRDEREQLEIVMRLSKRSASKVTSPESTPKSANKAGKRSREDDSLMDSERAAKKLKQEPPRAIDKKKMAALLQCHRKSLTPHPEVKARRRIFLPPVGLQSKSQSKGKPGRPRKSEPNTRPSPAGRRALRFGSLGHSDKGPSVTKKRKAPFIAINFERKLSLPKSSVAKMISTPSPPSRKMTRASRAARALQEPRQREVTDVLSALDLSRKNPVPTDPSGVLKKTSSPIADFTNVSGIKKLFSTEKTVDVRELFLEASNDLSPNRSSDSVKGVPGETADRRSLVLITTNCLEDLQADNSINSFNVEGVSDLQASPSSSVTSPIQSFSATSRRSLTLKGARASSLSSRDSAVSSLQSKNENTKILRSSKDNVGDSVGNITNYELDTLFASPIDNVNNRLSQASDTSFSPIRKRGQTTKHSIPNNSMDATDQYTTSPIKKRGRPPKKGSSPRLILNENSLSQSEYTNESSNFSLGSLNVSNQSRKSSRSSLIPKDNVSRESSDKTTGHKAPPFVISRHPEFSVRKVPRVSLRRMALKTSSSKGLSKSLQQLRRSSDGKSVKLELGKLDQTFPRRKGKRSLKNGNNEDVESKKNSPASTSFSQARHSGNMTSMERSEEGDLNVYSESRISHQSYGISHSVNSLFVEVGSFCQSMREKTLSLNPHTPGHSRSVPFLSTTPFHSPKSISSMAFSSTGKFVKSKRGQKGKSFIGHCSPIIVKPTRRTSSVNINLFDLDNNISCNLPSSTPLKILKPNKSYKEENTVKNASILDSTEISSEEFQTEVSVTRNGSSENDSSHEGGSPRNRGKRSRSLPTINKSAQKDSTLDSSKQFLDDKRGQSLIEIKHLTPNALKATRSTSSVNINLFRLDERSPRKSVKYQEVANLEKLSDSCNTSGSYQSLKTSKGWKNRSLSKSSADIDLFNLDSISSELNSQNNSNVSKKSKTVVHKDSPKSLPLSDDHTESVPTNVVLAMDVDKAKKIRTGTFSTSLKLENSKIAERSKKLWSKSLSSVNKAVSFGHKTSVSHKGDNISQRRSDSSKNITTEINEENSTIRSNRSVSLLSPRKRGRPRKSLIKDNSQTNRYSENNLSRDQSTLVYSALHASTPLKILKPNKSYKEENTVKNASILDSAEISSEEFQTEVSVIRNGSSCEKESPSIRGKQSKSLIMLSRSGKEDSTLGANKQLLGQSLIDIKQVSPKKIKATRSTSSVNINLFDLDNNVSHRLTTSTPLKIKKSEKSYREQNITTKDASILESKEILFSEKSQRGESVSENDSSHEGGSPRNRGKRSRSLPTINKSAKKDSTLGSSKQFLDDKRGQSLIEIKHLTPNALKATRSTSSVNINLFDMDNNVSHRLPTSTPLKIKKSDKSYREQNTTTNDASILESEDILFSEKSQRGENVSENDSSHEGGSPRNRGKRSRSLPTINKSAQKDTPLGSSKQFLDNKRGQSLIEIKHLTPNALKATRSTSSVNINLFRLDERSPRKSVKYQEVANLEKLSDSCNTSGSYQSLKTSKGWKNRSLSKSSADIDLFNLDSISFELNSQNNSNISKKSKTVVHKDSPKSLPLSDDHTESVPTNVVLAMDVDKAKKIRTGTFSTSLKLENSKIAERSKKLRSKSLSSVNKAVSFGHKTSVSHKGDNISQRRSDSIKIITTEINEENSIIRSNRSVSLLSPRKRGRPRKSLIKDNSQTNRYSENNLSRDQSTLVYSALHASTPLKILKPNKSYKEENAVKNASILDSTEISSEEFQTEVSVTRNGSSCEKESPSIKGKQSKSLIMLSRSGKEDSTLGANKQFLGQSLIDIKQVSPKMVKATRSTSSANINLFDLDNNVSHRLTTSTPLKIKKSDKSYREQNTTTKDASILESKEILFSEKSQRGESVSENDSSHEGGSPRNRGKRSRSLPTINKSAQKDSTLGSSKQFLDDKRGQSLIEIKHLTPNALKATRSTSSVNINLFRLDERSPRKSVKYQEVANLEKLSDSCNTSGSYQSLKTSKGWKNRSLSKSSADIDLFNLDSISFELNSQNNSNISKKSKTVVHKDSPKSLPLSDDHTESVPTNVVLAMDVDKAKKIRTGTFSTSLKLENSKIAERSKKLRSKSLSSVNKAVSFGHKTSVSHKGDNISQRRSDSIKIITTEINEENSIIRSNRSVSLLSPRKRGRPRKSLIKDNSQTNRYLENNLSRDQSSLVYSALNPRKVQLNKDIQNVLSGDETFPIFLSDSESDEESDVTESVSPQIETKSNKNKSHIAVSRATRSTMSVDLNLFRLDDSASLSSLTPTKAKSSLKKSFSVEPENVEDYHEVSPVKESSPGLVMKSKSSKRLSSSDTLPLKPTRSRTSLSSNLDLSLTPTKARTSLRRNVENSIAVNNRNDIMEENSKETQTIISADYANNKHSQTFEVSKSPLRSTRCSQPESVRDVAVSTTSSTSRSHSSPFANSASNTGIGKEFDQSMRSTKSSNDDKSTPLSALSSKRRFSPLKEKQKLSPVVKYTQTSLNVVQENSLKRIASRSRESQTNDLKDRNKSLVNSDLIRTKTGRTFNKASPRRGRSRQVAENLKIQSQNKTVIPSKRNSSGMQKQVTLLALSAPKRSKSLSKTVVASKIMKSEQRGRKGKVAAPAQQIRRGRKTKTSTEVVKVTSHSERGRKAKITSSVAERGKGRKTKVAFLPELEKGMETNVASPPKLRRGRKGKDLPPPEPRRGEKTKASSPEQKRFRKGKVIPSPPVLGGKKNPSPIHKKVKKVKESPPELHRGRKVKKDLPPELGRGRKAKATSPLPEVGRGRKAKASSPLPEVGKAKKLKEHSPEFRNNPEGSPPAQKEMRKAKEDPSSKVGKGKKAKQDPPLEVKKGRTAKTKAASSPEVGTGRKAREDLPPELGRGRKVKAASPLPESGKVKKAKEDVSQDLRKERKERATPDSLVELRNKTSGSLPRDQKGRRKAKENFSPEVGRERKTNKDLPPEVGRWRKAKDDDPPPEVGRGRKAKEAPPPPEVGRGRKAKEDLPPEVGRQRKAKDDDPPPEVRRGRKAKEAPPPEVGRGRKAKDLPPEVRRGRKAIEASPPPEVGRGRRAKEASPAPEVRRGRKAKETSPAPEVGRGRKAKEASLASDVGRGRKAKEASPPPVVGRGRRAKEASPAPEVRRGRKAKEASPAPEVRGGRKAKEASPPEVGRGRKAKEASPASDVGRERKAKEDPPQETRRGRMTKGDPLPGRGRKIKATPTPTPELDNKTKGSSSTVQKRGRKAKELERPEKLVDKSNFAKSLNANLSSPAVTRGNPRKTGEKGRKKVRIDESSVVTKKIQAKSTKTPSPVLPKKTANLKKTMKATKNTMSIKVKQLSKLSSSFLQKTLIESDLFKKGKNKKVTKSVKKEKSIENEGKGKRLLRSGR